MIFLYFYRQRRAEGSLRKQPTFLDATTALPAREMSALYLKGNITKGSPRPLKSILVNFIIIIIIIIIAC